MTKNGAGCVVQPAPFFVVPPALQPIPRTGEKGTTAATVLHGESQGKTRGPDADCRPDDEPQARVVIPPAAVLLGPV